MTSRAVLSVLSLLCACAPPPAPAECSATPASLDFGLVEATSEGKFLRVQVRHRSDVRRNVTISPLAFPFHAEPNATLMLSPNTSNQVLVTFAPPDGRLYRDELLMRSEDGFCDLTVPLLGLGSGKLRANPAELELILNEGETRKAELRLENTRRVPLSLSYAAQPAVSVAFPEGQEIAAGGALRLEVTGTLDGWLRNDVILLVSSEFEQLNIPIKLIPSSPRVEVTPLRLDVPVVGVDLNSVPKGFVERVIRVRNVGASGDPSAPGLTVNGVFLSPGMFDPRELSVTAPMFNPLRENEFMDVSIRFTPLTTGPRAFQLQVQTTAGGALVPFSTIARALPPCGMNVSPEDRLVLREVPDGGLEGTVSFDNIGNTPCTVDGVRLSGATPSGFMIDGPVKEQLEVAPKTVRQLTITGPRQTDAGIIGALGYHVFKENADVRSISLEQQ